MTYVDQGTPGHARSNAVLQDFSLSVREGEFLSVLGPSGCGKSSFLNILAGLVPQTKGDVRIDGQILTGVSRKLGVVFQGYALFPWRTVIENIEIGLEIRDVKRAERRAEATRFLALVGLQAYGNHYPHQLSGGMRQRVAIARALAYGPEVLLMDEPFGALDAQTRESLQSELLGIWEKSAKTVVFITHSIDEAIFLSDRVAIMTRGPGRVKEIIDIPLPRPRDDSVRNSTEFLALRQRAWAPLKTEVAEARDVPAQEQTRTVDA
ncbi:MAG: ABC transporter ATP-binding protein [Pseudomonadota bacterium]|nr:MULTISPECIES: ABC transporter ATP-binding protein [Burkholderiaceae]MDP9152915.1 ABC transporter ATP-binding protein [Pseudomonadota bacterium]